MSKLILTCEHGGNIIPDQYQKIFYNSKDTLKTHRGYDPGALELAEYLEKKLKVSLFYATVSRLLIELNRSIHHPNLFSSITKGLSAIEKKDLIKDYYWAYRNQVEKKTSELIDQQQDVIHVSIHSFTPVLNHIERNCDIGLLYDPKRKAERDFCKLWKIKIKEENPQLRVRYNYPYKGVSDGFTTYLRKKFPKKYIGIELEVNQKILFNNQKVINQNIYKSISCLVNEETG